MALKLDILANTRQLVSEMKKGGASVEDISDSLDEMAKDGEKATEKLERSFKEMATHAKKADNQIEKIGGPGGGFSKAGDAAGEFKQEALANFSEVTSSFDGSMSSIADLAQGTLGGLAGAIPGIGLAAGVAAAGIGLIGAQMQANEEKAKETTENIVADFISMGDALSSEAVKGRIDTLLNTEDGRKQIDLLSQLLEVGPGRAALIMAGDFESAGVTIEETLQAIAEAPGNVSLDLLSGIKSNVETTTKALQIGEDAARTMESAAQRLGATERQEQQRTVDNARKRRDELVALYSQPIRGKVIVDADITPLQWKLQEVQRQANRGINVVIRPGQVVWN